MGTAVRQVFGGGFPTARTGNHRFDGVKRIFCPIFLGPQNPVPLCAITMLRGTLERIEALHIPMANQKRLPNSSRIFSIFSFINEFTQRRIRTRLPAPRISAQNLLWEWLNPYAKIGFSHYLLAIVPKVPRLMKTLSGLKTRVEISVKSKGARMARQDNYRSRKAAWCVFSTGDIR